MYERTGRPLEVRWNGHVLPYRLFDKDQRVNETAIVENKRLGHALAIVKAQLALRDRTKVLNNSEKGGYRKHPRQRYGPDFVKKPLAPKTVEMMESHKPRFHTFPPYGYEAGPAVHLAFYELEPMDLAFDVALVPRQSESFAHSTVVSFQTCGEAGRCNTSCGLKPCRKCLEIAVPEHAEEGLGKLRECANLG